MHLAAATGTPTLGLFNVTDPARYAPYGGANTALRTSRRSPQEVAAATAAWFVRLRSTVRASADTPARTGAPIDRLGEHFVIAGKTIES